MKEDKEIIEDFRRELINDLMAENAKGSQKTNKSKTIDLLLVPIDYPEENLAKKQILEELKQKEIISDYSIIVKEIELYPQKLPLQKELYADETYKSPEIPSFNETMMIAKVTFDPHQLKVKLRKYYQSPERIIYTINIDRSSQSIIINKKIRIDFSAKRGNKETKEWRIFHTLFETAMKVKHSHYILHKKIIPKYSLKTLKEDIGAITIEAVEAAAKRLREKLIQERLPIRLYISKKRELISMTIELSNKSPQTSKQSTN